MELEYIRLLKYIYKSARYPNPTEELSSKDGKSEDLKQRLIEMWLAYTRRVINEAVEHGVGACTAIHANVLQHFGLL